MLHHNTNSLWVTLLHLFARHSHSLCLIPWPIGSGWHCFICLPVGSLRSSIMSHLMSNRQWVTLLHLGPCSLINHVSSHDQQPVSDAASFVYNTLINEDCKPYAVFHLAISLALMLWPIVSMWHIILACHFPWHHTQSVSENGFIFYLTLCILSLDDEQAVSDKPLSDCTTSYSMSNRKWVEFYFMSKQSTKWSTASQSNFWDIILSHFMAQPLFDRM